MILRLTALAIAVAGPAAPQTQQDLNAQAAAGFRKADAAMNVAYRAALARAKAADAERNGGPMPSNPTYAGALLAAQRAWLPFRDAECLNRSYDNFGGSMQPMTLLTCKQTLTEQRTKQLLPRPEGG